MEILRKDCFEKVYQSILDYGRTLEKSLLEVYFKSGNEHDVIKELVKFQNNDGGFGHGLESDFRLPYSSPMQTSVGLRILSEFDHIDKSKEMIKKAIRYLEVSFDQNRNGWFVASKQINDFPHAPWWHFNEKEGMTIIDKNWGNPSAELVAYLYKYRDYVENIDILELVEYAIDYLSNKEECKSENEIYCYIELYNVLPDQKKQRLEKPISLAIEQVINYNQKEWHEYVPRPVDFVENQEQNTFGINQSKINDNLDFIIAQFVSNEKIVPPWGESYYKGDLNIAYNEWIGVLNLKALITLDKFNRIEK